SRGVSKDGSGQGARWFETRASSAMALPDALLTMRDGDGLVVQPQISKIREIDFENVAALQCGIAKLCCDHAILSWRFELG
ncbi:MAG: hypothetical protein Q7U92_22630, partial [Bradyrhizobium sp.]|nr:hypothetical protein [Bradyrhizobium sp.]